MQSSVETMLKGDLTVEQAVQIALLNNQNLQATFEDLGIAEADLVQAGLLKNPVFDLGVRIPTTPPSRTYVDVNVSEDFVSLFFIAARKRLAADQLETVKSRVTGQVLSLAADTKVAFYNVQAAQQQMALRQSIADAVAASADTAKRLHDAGNNTDLDLINARTQRARAKVELLSAQTEVAEARERLNDLMGLGHESLAWKIVDRLPDLPRAEVEPQKLDEIAILQRLDLTAARQDVDLAAGALGLTRQTRFLTDANIGAEGERETDGQWRVGPSVSIPVPVFDQGQAQLTRQQALFRQSQRRYWAMAVEVRTQVRALAARLIDTRAKAQLYHDEVLPLQQNLVDQTQLQYNGMLSGVFELLQARRDQIDVAREYIQALEDYWTTRAELEKAIGGKLPVAVTTQPAQTGAMQ